jgi:hypothetical protein
MRQFTSGGFLSSVFSMLLVGSASACINDREVANSEREFKSQYKSDYQTQPAIESSEPTNRLLSYGATGLGSALLLGSVVVTLRRPS